jgi:hypothetical protein
MGQMAWLDSMRGDSDFKILHLRFNPGEPWQPYTSAKFANLRKPDLAVPGASKGYPTFQFLLKAKWEVIATDKARSLDIIPPDKHNDDRGQPQESSENIHRQNVGVCEIKVSAEEKLCECNARE